MEIFETKYKEYLKEFGEGKKMVLSTSVDNIVSSRMMSIVQIGGDYYFQTDVNFKKYEELITNPNVALCIDNIQIEGVAKEIGKPLNNPLFIDVFKRNFLGSYNTYSALEIERLFIVKANRIERWQYVDKEAFIEIYDLQTKEYSIKKYLGK